MNWKFWKKEAPAGGGGGSKSAKLGKPRDLPEPVGRKMVVEMKLDPDEVWSLKYVGRPAQNGGKSSEFRIFNPTKAQMAGVNVKDWTSLDDRPELILYTGIFDKGSNKVDMR